VRVLIPSLFPHQALVNVVNPVPTSADNYQKILKSFVADPPKFFTFNDGFGQNPPSSVKFAFEELLPAMFPERSQYELAEAPSGLSVK
jgi:hypothetical protein